MLFDRDGTLVHDVAYNRDPEQVVPVPTARAALDRLRAQGIGLGVVSNQSGLARGLLSIDELAAVNARVEEILGPFGTWQICPHGPGDGCACRKPAPGLILAAAAALGVPVSDCVVIGDIGADVGAALAAGAQAVLVPTAVTRRAEIAHAATVASVAGDLAEAAELALTLLARQRPYASAGTSR